MGFGEAISAGFSRYVDFQGRSVRSEYWFFTLFLFLVAFALAIVDIAVLRSSLLGILFTLATIIPSLAVSVRRLHDLDRSGWWLLIVLIPIIGAIVLIYWACQPGTPGTNRFG